MAAHAERIVLEYGCLFQEGCFLRVPSPLFRLEVIEARRNAWLGEAQIIQPLPVRIVALACVVMVAAFGLYAWQGTYTRRIHAVGLLAPDIGTR